MSDFSSSEEELHDSEENNLKQKFNKAADHVQKHYSSLDQNTLLEIYGLYKQSVDGKCNTPKPGLFNFQAKAKWEAWNKLDNMSKEEAMQKYVEIIENTGVTFDNENKHGSKSDKKSQWVCHSLPTTHNDEIIKENEKTTFDYVKEKNLDKIRELVNITNVNELDDSGIGVIHWAADRGATDILEHILEYCSADVNLRDREDQTALHYASSCGHTKCVELLLKFGADKNLIDDCGQKSLDVAFDDTIKSIIINFN